MVIESHPGHDRPRGGRSRPRAARALERQARKAAFRRYLKLTLLAAVLPGSGFIAAGRRRLGAVILALVGLLVVAAAVVLVTVGPRQLGLRVAVRPQALTWVGVGLAAAAVAWVLLLVGSQKVLEPRWLSLRQRLTGSVLVIVLASAVAAPLALGSQYAFVQRDLVTTIFEDTPLAVNEHESLTRPKNVTVEDPWAGARRVNVLLIGSDSSSKRIGTRTDTMIVASIDTHTGSTVLFSLPRNLQRTPFPPGPFRRAYPYGFTNPNNPQDYLLNAVYDVVPAENPQLFPKTIKRPGVEALKLTIGATLGLRVDYYVMVNLGGFREVIDALGGIRVNVNYPIPIGSKQLPSGVCSRPTGFISPGKNKLLNGDDALTFARARCGSGELADADNSRMRRQRCVIGAIVDRADPATLLRRYQALAGAAKRILSTDIPQALLPAFAELGELVQESEVRSLPFTAQALKGRNYNPDFAEIRRLVKRALTPATATATASPKRSPQASRSPVSRERTGEQSGEAQPLDAVC